MKLRFLLIAFVLTAQPLWGPQMAEGQQASPSKAGNASSKNKQPVPPTHVIVDPPLPAVTTQPVAANDQTKAPEEPLPRFERPEWVTVYITAIYVLIAGLTLRAIKRQAELMDRQAMDARGTAAQQMRDVQASIAEATRASSAMEGIAESMASNVASVRESVGISREIADMQKLATELHSRAYLSAVFNSAIFQDANHVFEAHAVLRNHGNTPAYDVTFRAASQIVPLPIPDDFAFPLPDETAGASVSFMAPGTTKLISRCVTGKVPDTQVAAIKLGVPPRCLAMWGSVEYRDAFGKTRRTRFAFTVNWVPWVPGMDKDKEGNPLPEQVFSHDTARHNDAD